jgi:hypothetical protein
LRADVAALQWPAAGKLAAITGAPQPGSPYRRRGAQADATGWGATRDARLGRCGNPPTPWCARNFPTFPPHEKKFMDLTTPLAYLGRILLPNSGVKFVARCPNDLVVPALNGDEKMLSNSNAIHVDFDQDVMRVYDPVVLKRMTVAFDQAWQSLPPNMRISERARRRLALIIIRHVDRGEYDAAALADRAVLDFMR